MCPAVELNRYSSANRFKIQSIKFDINHALLNCQGQVKKLSPGQTYRLNSWREFNDCDKFSYVSAVVQTRCRSFIFFHRNSCQFFKTVWIRLFDHHSHNTHIVIIFSALGRRNRRNKDIFGLEQQRILIMQVVNQKKTSQPNHLTLSSSTWLKPLNNQVYFSSIKELFTLPSSVWRLKE